VNQLAPKAVGGLTGVRSCAAGHRHTVCTMEDSTVKTFGLGDYGQLGHGDTANQLTPKAVEGLMGVRSCAAGHRHTVCTMEDSTVKTFGSGGQGQLGHGDTVSQLAPKAVEGLTGVRSCAAGSGHTVCTMEDSLVKTFGLGGEGRLGHGDTVNQLAPKAVEGLMGVHACAGGEYHTVCTMEDSTVKTFGLGFQAQLGHGDTASQLAPRAVEGLTGVRSCAAGGGHTACTMEDSTVKTFGQGSDGQLGHGDTAKQLSPLTIEEGLGVEGSVSASACPSGKFQNASNATFCYECATGNFESQAGQTNCSTCPKGNYCPWEEGGLDVPRLCPFGHYSNALGLAKCHSCRTGGCPAGKHREGCILRGQEKDDSECKGGCAPGSYGVLVNGSESNVCNRWGSINREDERGICEEVRTSQQSECVVCPRGYFQNEFGHLTCARCGTCSTGAYRQGCGNVSEGICSKCVPGQALVAGGTECIGCSSGFSQPAVGQTECIACESGRFQNKPGQAFCDGIQVNQYIRRVDVTSEAGVVTSEYRATECPHKPAFSRKWSVTVCLGSLNFQTISGETDCKVTARSKHGQRRIRTWSTTVQPSTSVSASAESLQTEAPSPVATDRAVCSAASAPPGSIPRPQGHVVNAIS
jgi:alpha-tubulin suppressor-like RCC1 family protein